MEVRRVGSHPLRVSVLGFGCGAIGGLFVRGEAGEQRAAVERALASGVTYFDTAAQYGDGESERNLGRVLRELGADAVVGTKARLGAHDLPDASRALRRKLEESLVRLGRDHIDVFTLHNGLTAGPAGDD